MNAGVAVQVLMGRLLDHRGQMNGVDQFGVREGVGHPAQGGHDGGHRLAVVLPPGTSDQNYFSVHIIQAVQDSFPKGELL